MEKLRSMVKGMDVKALVLKLISEAKGTIPEKLNESQHLVNDVGLDSIDIVELSLQLENLFDIGIPDADFEKWDTVGSVITYIENKEEKP